MILPRVSALVTLVIISLVLGYLVYKIIRQPKKQLFPLFVVQSGMIFFFFGYQVHEKAIMMPLTILQLYSVMNHNTGRLLELGFVMSFTAGVSLFPLFFHLDVIYIVWMLFLIYHLVYYQLCQKIKNFNLNRIEKFLIWFSIGIIYALNSGIISKVV